MEEYDISEIFFVSGQTEKQLRHSMAHCFHAWKNNLYIYQR
jgi:hypothetical protein